MRRAMTALTAVFVAGTMMGAPQAPAPRVARPALASFLDAGGRHPERPAEAGAAAEWMAERNGSLDPAVAFEASLAAWRQARKAPAAAGALGRGWKELGPKPYRTDDPEYNDPFNGGPPTGTISESGLVAALAVDPNDRTGRTVWAGTEGGGVWVSRDAGIHWKTSWDAMPSPAIGAIAFDKVRSKTMYVGTGEGNFASFSGTGVYRSLNDGKTFTRTARNVKANVVSRIVARGGMVYVATDRGLWRSTDGGNSYQDVKLPTAENGHGIATGVFANYVSDVAIHPSRPNEITAVVGAPRGKLSGPGNGIYRSTKGGAPGTWTRLDASGLAGGSLSDDPLGRVSIAYAEGPTQDHDVLWALVQDAGLYNGSIKGGQANHLATSLNGIYRSGDDGATWTLKATPSVLAAAPGSGLVGLAALYSPGIQARYNQFIAVSPLDAERVFVGLEEIYQTAANANGPGLAAWTTIGRYWDMCLYPVNVGCDVAPVGPYAGHVTPHSDQHAVALGAGGTILYAGNDGGVYIQQSPDGTFSNEGWEPGNDTLGTTLAYYATMGTDGTVYAGLQDNGFAKITPDGKGINTFVGDGGDVAVEPSNSDNAWSEYVFGTVFKTTDGGRTWVNAAPELSGAQFIAPMEMDVKNEKHVVLGGAEIVETTIGTDTVCTNEFLVTGTHAGPCDWVVSYTLPAGRVAASLDVQGSTIYAGYCGLCTPSTKDDSSAAAVRNGLATNRKKGCTPAPGSDACWHIATAKGLPNRMPTDVKIDPANPSVVYVTVGGYSSWWRPLDRRTPNLGRGHVFVSRDSGETFTDISSNLPDAPAYSVESRGSRLFVGTLTGVYTAAKPGARWERLGRGLPNVATMDVNLNPQGTKLLAATYGRGMWLYTL